MPPLAAGIRAARPDALIILAGYPQDQVKAHQQAGVDDFIHVRANTLELLAKIHARLGLTDENVS